MVESFKKDGELSIYVERMYRLIQLMRIYDMVLAIPESNETEQPHLTMCGTMMSVVYSFFYSLIEPDSKGVDFFRIWRDRLPEATADIDALEACVLPIRDDLRLFRNRFGFHGCTSREREEKGFNLILNHKGSEIYQVIIDTRNLSTKLLNMLMKS